MCVCSTGLLSWIVGVNPADQPLHRSHGGLRIRHVHHQRQSRDSDSPLCLSRAIGLDGFSTASQLRSSVFSVIRSICGNSHSLTGIPPPGSPHFHRTWRWPSPQLWRLIYCSKSRYLNYEAACALNQGKCAPLDWYKAILEIAGKMRKVSAGEWMEPSENGEVVKISYRSLLYKLRDAGIPATRSNSTMAKPAGELTTLTDTVEKPGMPKPMVMAATHWSACRSQHRPGSEDWHRRVDSVSTGSI